MEINFLFFISVVPAIILYGIAKSGLGGSISLISVPLMTIVMPLQQALAIILPILIFSDVIAVYRFRREFDFSTLKLIVPFAAIGIVIGSFTFNNLLFEITYLLFVFIAKSLSRVLLSILLIFLLFFLFHIIFVNFLNK